MRNLVVKLSIAVLMAFVIVDGITFSSQPEATASLDARRSANNSYQTNLSSSNLIAFSSELGTSNGNGEIYTMDEDGTSLTRLTIDTTSDYNPNISPDGRKIVFTSVRHGNPEIYVMKSDGTEVVRLTDNPADDDKALWSPDSSKIAFMSRRAGNYDVWVMNSDGANQTRLTTTPGWDSRPSWSPDGSKIAYDCQPSPAAICIMNADGSNVIRLPRQFEGGNHLDPKWSPDGTKIAYMGDFGGGNTDIFVMNIDGTNQINLTKHSAFDAWPSWSPDGTRIAFSSDRDGDSDIWIMNADSTELDQATHNLVWDSHPSWSAKSTTSPPVIEITDPVVVNNYSVSQQKEFFQLVKDNRDPIDVTASIILKDVDLVDRVAVRLWVGPETELQEIELGRVAQGQYEGRISFKVSSFSVIEDAFWLVIGHKFPGFVTPGDAPGVCSAPFVTIAEVVVTDVFGVEHVKLLGEEIVEFDPFGNRRVRHTGLKLPTICKAIDDNLEDWQHEHGTYIGVFSPVDLFVKRLSDGKVIGALYNDGTLIGEINEIDGFYSGREPGSVEFIYLPLADDVFEISLIGTGEGKFEFVVLGATPSGKNIVTIEGSIVDGAIQKYNLKTSSDDISLFPLLENNPESKIINESIELESVVTSYDPLAIEGYPGGIFRVEATFRNVSNSAILLDLFAKVAVLEGAGCPCDMLNADEFLKSVAGVGAEVPLTEILHMDGSIKKEFEIGLSRRQPFRFFVDIWGLPFTP